jgi:hypothetical protein
MKKLIVSFIVGILLSVSHISAQQVEVPVAEQDATEVVKTIKVEFEKPKNSDLNVRYKNSLESLTEDQINQIIANLEERSKASLEMYSKLDRTMESLNSILEDKAFLENKVIYQAKKHYNLSESEVKRALRSKHWIDLAAYLIIFLYFMVIAIRLKKRDAFKNGYLDMSMLGRGISIFAVNSGAMWFIIRPIVSVLVNPNYEIITFLLKG